MRDVPILQLEVPGSAGGWRLDRFVTGCLPDLSRARVQSLIQEGRVNIPGQRIRSNLRVKPGMIVEVYIPPPEPVDLVPEAIALDLLYEDGDILVINKPAGLVVHPAPGHPRGTLVHALLYHCRDLAGVGGEQRPGIVHRLDKDTSGVMVVAKNDLAMQSLAGQFKDGTIRKEYLALVAGTPPGSGTVDTLIGRNPLDRKTMSAKPRAGRRAVTHFKLEERLGPASLVRVCIETGRTHQIRVHFAHLGHPVLGDKQYGRTRGTRLPVPVHRQMLHARRLEFKHPRHQDVRAYEAPLPADLTVVLEALRLIRDS